MIIRKYLSMAAVFCALAASPHAAAQRPPMPNPRTIDRAVDDTAKRVNSSTYVLGADDQVVVVAVNVEEISGKPQRLDPNGDLRLPMVGRVHAAGMTVEDLENELKKRLSFYLQEPDVTVTVAEYRSQPVSVIGAVAQPGVKQLEGRKTLVEILSMAGGVTADAGPTVRIARKRTQGRIPLPEATDDPTGEYSTVELDTRALLESRAPAKNIMILPNDVISIPRAAVVYVVGEVTRPGPVPVSGQSISIMEAVSTSGGVMRTAAPSHTRILRRIDGQDKRTELTVDLKKIMNGKALDTPLKAGDILMVPDSSGKKVTARAIEAAIQMGTMIGTYGVIR
jgi:polysaccharide export outer membrane protein